MSTMTDETRTQLRRQLAALEDRLADLELALSDLMHDIVAEVAETGTDNIGSVLADLATAAKLYRYQQLVVEVIEGLPGQDPWWTPRPTVDVDTGGRT